MGATARLSRIPHLLYALFARVHAKITKRDYTADRDLTRGIWTHASGREWRGKLKVGNYCAYIRLSAALRGTCNFRRLNPRDARRPAAAPRRLPRSPRDVTSSQPEVDAAYFAGHFWRKFSIFLHNTVPILISFYPVSAAATRLYYTIKPRQLPPPIVGTQRENDARFRSFIRSSRSAPRRSCRFLQ